MSNIHPTAVVDPKAEIADDAEIGPFCVIGGDVRIGSGCRLLSHVCVAGATVMGARNTVYPFASIGHQPQDQKFKGEASRLEIGDDNVIREQVTLNPGTEGGGLVTRVGNNCLLMIGAHVAHDCLIGDHVILVNNATLAGHVEIGDFAILGGLSAVHQFARVGKHAMIGGMSGVEADVIPYGLVTGNRARLQGLNIVGLKRRGFSRQEIHDMRTAYRLLFAEEGTMAERLDDVERLFADKGPIAEIVAFIRAASQRSLVQPHAGGGDDD